MSSDAPDQGTAPWVRVAIVLVATATASLISLSQTGSLVPSRPSDALIFQSSLLLVVLGSAILEPKFTRPADSVVNGLMGAVTMVTVFGSAPRLAWWLVFAYCVLVFAVAAVCTVVSTGPEISGLRRRVADVTFHPSVYFGRARLVYSIVFLFGVFSFYGTGSHTAAVLVVFWGLFLAIWPLRVPEFLSRIRKAKVSRRAVGRVVRREWPALIRVALEPNTQWATDRPFVFQDADGVQHLAVPLYKQLRDQQGIATALQVPFEGEALARLDPGHVYPLPADEAPTREEINLALGAGKDASLIGFIVEDSHIGTIRFETWRPDLCREGLLVWCSVSADRVFYQITEGATREEALESDRLGSQVATAAQMGTLDAQKGFLKANWLPTMNTPVFAEDDKFGKELDTVGDEDFLYGTVPGTSLKIGGAFQDAIEFHTAILGVTGSGKTELAFDLIRHSAAQGVKVICIDLTARYEGHLQDLAPVNLSISPENAKALSEKLFGVETGEYGAPNEKKALGEFRSELYKDVSKKLSDFLLNSDSSVGIITLDEISNTKATLVVTELYMTSLLHFARDDSEKCPQTLVVVEEAHTVMPETATMGLGDYESRGLVGKIAQIALQGRKYKIGLLIVAQRTATVTKSVLTQCNTIVALTSFDETTVGFLSNVYGRTHAEALRDLPPLHAVIFGKGIRSQRPIIVEIPYDPKKDPLGLMAG